MNLFRQLALLFSICVAGAVLSAAGGGFLPGSVLAMVLLLVLLLTRVLRLEALERTADFFLANMAFFFLPSTLGILKVYGQIRSELAKLALVCTATTLLTAACAGWAAAWVRRLQERKGRP